MRGSGMRNPRNKFKRLQRIGKQKLYEIKLCERCQIEKFRVNGSQRFCGNKIKKTGCAYKHYLERAKITGKIWRLNNLERHNFLMARWQKNHKKIVNEKTKLWRQKTGYLKTPYQRERQKLRTRKSRAKHSNPELLK